MKGLTNYVKFKLFSLATSLVFCFASTRLKKDPVVSKAILSYSLLGIIGFLLITARERQVVYNDKVGARNNMMLAFTVIIIFIIMMTIGIR